MENEAPKKSDAESTKPQLYTVGPARYAPILLSLCILLWAYHISWWHLILLPFVWLGAFCTSPNPNLINMSPAIIAVIIGFILTPWQPLAGLAACVTIVSFFLSTGEIVLRMKPEDS